MRQHKESGRSLLPKLAGGENVVQDTSQNPIDTIVSKKKVFKVPNTILATPSSQLKYETLARYDKKKQVGAIG